MLCNIKFNSCFFDILFVIIVFSWMEFIGLFAGHTKQCHIPHILCLEVKYWPCLKIHLGL